MRVPQRTISAKTLTNILENEAQDKVKSAPLVYLCGEGDAPDAGIEAAVQTKNGQSVHRLRIPDTHVHL